MSILDTKRAAQFLGVHPVTLRNLAMEGKVPCRKVGREWRFSVEHLTDWLKGDNSKQEETGDTQWQSSSAATSGGSASPRQTASEYESLLGLHQDAKQQSTKAAEKQNSGAFTSSETSRAESGRKQ